MIHSSEKSNYTCVYMPREGGFIWSHAQKIGGIISCSCNELLYFSFPELTAPSPNPHELSHGWASAGSAHLSESTLPVPSLRMLGQTYACLFWYIVSFLCSCLPPCHVAVWVCGWLLCCLKCRGMAFLLSGQLLRFTMWLPWGVLLSESNKTAPKLPSESILTHFLILISFF